MKKVYPKVWDEYPKLWDIYFKLWDEYPKAWDIEFMWSKISFPTDIFKF